MEKDLSLTLLLHQRDYLGAARYVNDNVVAKERRDASFAEILGEAREHDPAAADEIERLREFDDVPTADYTRPDIL